ncbi:hypothetical protein M9H77_27622 [Catharanthus roseus]|uniref:Uncharacterized protein n=1 Tax=Catharanthus roseus TaxID=4058 RepID=A0ACC0AF68_CATRO|nr:hypothetical protein M9H77_27622 [Catharanthus roseus]
MYLLAVGKIKMRKSPTSLDEGADEKVDEGTGTGERDDDEGKFLDDILTTDEVEEGVEMGTGLEYGTAKMKLRSSYSQSYRNRYRRRRSPQKNRSHRRRSRRLNWRSRHRRRRRLWRNRSRCWRSRHLRVSPLLTPTYHL